jgi:hypothetical protein
LALYNNISTIDPKLIDPENGNYRPENNSPASNYGCQTFGKINNKIKLNLTRVNTLNTERKNSIKVQGNIKGNQTWNADQ